MKHAALVFAFLFPLTLPSWASAESFPDLIDRYYREWARLHPVSATMTGWHDHDRVLDDQSQAGLAELRTWLSTWEKRLSAVDTKPLAPAALIDLEALEQGIESQQVALDVVQAWRRQPNDYVELASAGVYAIIKRSFAPEAERMALVVAREKQIPTLLLAARKNLDLASRIPIETTLMQLGDVIEFFQRDVPAAFPSVKEQSALQASTAEVVKALTSYGEWLKKDLLPKARADFAIGEPAFRKKLHADEMIDTPIDELIARGEAELHRLQKEYRDTAAKIDPKRSLEEVQKDTQKDHPLAAKLIEHTGSRLIGLRKFLVDHHIVTLPADTLPAVQETPPFLRATTVASLDAPGPFESRSTQAYYNVTLPDKDWTPAQVEDYLRGAFSRPLIEVVSIHEAFPGHYTQALWLPRLSSPVRKMESSNTNVEGWAHYCEQMMLDEGWGQGDSRLRLAQLQDALLRAARYVAGIRMHTRGMSYEQAVEFFQKQGLQSKKVAEMESRRGVEDPTYLYYTLGKLEILKLRDDYRKKLGAAYTLQKFHDAFLAEGAIALPLVRRALLEGQDLPSKPKR